MCCKRTLRLTSPTLIRLALQVLELELNLDLNAIWVSRSDPRLQKADALTKQVNWDDWSVHSDAFNTLQQWFRVSSINLFPLPENFKVARYYSFSFAASCSGVDAFLLSWEGENAYCAPPIALILRVIRKIEVSEMKGVLLIPLWRGACFWLHAFPDMLHAFPDGRHLGGVFRSFRQLKIKTRLWGISPKDAFAGKWVFFLALEIDSRGDGRSLESVVSRNYCFGRLFGKDCIC
jgi:hypothetical protein